MFILLEIPTMTRSSKPKKIKAKARFQELKLVQTVSRKGLDTVKTEEIKTPRRGRNNGPSTSQPHQSSSPTKRPKLDTFDEEPIPFNLEARDGSGKRKTLVAIYSSYEGSFSDYL
jgi:hypothetical protein